MEAPPGNRHGRRFPGGVSDSGRRSEDDVTDLPDQLVVRFRRSEEIEDLLGGLLRLIAGSRDAVDQGGGVHLIL